MEALKCSIPHENARRTFRKIYLEITNCCNLNCSFCHGTSRASKSLSLEEFELLTDKVKGSAEYLYFHLLGEPLLHPQLCRFIDIAAEKGFHPMLTTNGTLLARCGPELLKSRLYKISISLHAPEANTGFSDTEYLKNCVAFAEESSAKGIITVFRLWNLGGKDADNEKILDKLHSTFPNDWTANRSGYRIAPNLFLEWGEKFEWPDAAGEPTGEDLFCYGLRDQIGILSDGTVVPCCLDAEGSIALGNLFEMDLDSILASERAQEIYNGFSRHKAVEDLCTRCGYAAQTKQYRKK